MNKLFLTLAIMACSSLANAQSLSVKVYNWEPERKLTVLSESQKKEPSIMLYNGVTLESDYSNANQNALEYVELVHRIIRINSAEDIDKYNKVYIGLNPGESIIELKARAIAPSGKVTELNKNNIKEIKDEENANYKIFAIEGAEPGGEVEYLYKKNKHFSSNGYYKVPIGPAIEKAVFQIISPENLVIEMKAYNHPIQVADSVGNGKRSVKAVIKDFPAYTEEAFSNQSAFQPRLEYKLAYNKARGNARMNTFNEAAQNIYRNVFVLAPKDQKLAASAYKNAKLKATGSEKAKIQAIDNYIRRNIRITKESSNDELAKVLQQKAASELGIMRLYAAFFKLAGVEYQLVTTTNRYERKFDPAFDSWSYLDEQLFYFPGVNKYLSPTDFSMPFGPVPSYLANNHGLFVKKVTVGDFESGIGEVKFIPLPGSNYSSDNLDIKVEFVDNMQKTKLDITKSVQGYYATNSLAVYPFLEDEKKEELKKVLAAFMVKDGTSEKVTLSQPVEYPMLDTVYNLAINITTPEFLETAGRKTLFKIGELIGPQSELYSETSRKTDIENSFNRQYNRTITFAIPAGFVLKNPEVLKMNVSCVKDKEKVFVFESDYVTNGNTVTVTVHEAYERIDYPQSGYEDFRKVINAAADFNKITLILEPRG